ncbi:MAG TPA: hypothetical protein VNW97_22150 [Candidatus Saccharimonadales bacterium]|nr:hypothetical protein [Candidatus Saccharimonadales bacterium]
MHKDGKVKYFWAWFSSMSASLAADIGNPSLLEELDARVRELDSMLSWEVGPGSSEPWQLVISPNLNRDLRQRSQEIISCAPVLEGWEFYSARRPKDWDYKFVMERSDGRESIELDASAWFFVLLQYPDGVREVLLQGNNLPALDDDERWQAAAVTLEGILGEELILENIDEFELMDRFEPRFVVQQRPIQGLREAIVGATGSA